MGKLEPFERKQTKWEGLWWHPETNSFSSGTISLSDLKKFKGKVRIQIRKNKFFNGGENRRPNYLFTIRDSDSEAFKNLEVIHDEEDEHSTWVWQEELCGLTILEGYVCDKCGYKAGRETTNYCPDCGSRMEVGDEARY